jgi:DNA-binding PadR family transcriptional regulator
MAAPPINGATLDILGLLLQAWEEKTEVYGWLIMKSLRRSGPTVYRALDRLEDAGWITGSWESPPPPGNQPRRRFYRLTAEGVEAARAERVPRPTPARRLRLQPGHIQAATA